MTGPVKPSRDNGHEMLDTDGKPYVDSVFDPDEDVDAKRWKPQEFSWGES